VFGVILGTGVGGGIVVDRKLISGKNRNAGEWGHNPLPWPNADEWPGPACYCGKTGCIETFLSGTGLSRAYHSLSHEIATAEEIASKAEIGDSTALQCLSLYQSRLVRSLATLINIFDPDIIVFGGGLSNIEYIYRNIVSMVQEFAFTEIVETAIVRAVHGDSSGVRGAAYLWPSTN